MVSDVLILIGFVAAPVVGLWLVLFGIRRYATEDRAIDALIALNRAKPCVGMEMVDWMKVNRAGERTWAKALRGQRRYSTMTVPLQKPDSVQRVN